jgi:peroxiredoxin
MRHQASLAMICGIIFSAAYLIAVSGPPLSAQSEPSKKPAPNFTLNDPKGSPVRLSDYKGKVVLLNFWATWCHGCVQEMPWFMEFQDKYRDKGLAVIGVSTDDDGWKSVTPFVREKKVNYVVLIDDKKVSAEFGLAAMPMTVLIDRDGNIVSKHEGVVDRDAFEKKILSLLKEKGATRAAASNPS